MELVTKLVGIINVDAAAARCLLQEASWSLEGAEKIHHQQEAWRKAEIEAARIAAEEAQKAAAEKAAAERAAAERAARAREKEKQRLGGMGHRVCTRHWHPRPSAADTCIRLFQGERVQVTWIAEEEEGWAYGHAVDDQSKEGYFPQSILAQLSRKPQQHAVGERVLPCQRFQAPEEVGGYLTVNSSDTLQILHPLEPPYVWAYVGRMGKDDTTPVEAGWVPECILGESLDSRRKHLFQSEHTGPQPAG